MSICVLKHWRLDVIALKSKHWRLDVIALKRYFSRTHYDVLGVKTTASGAEIKLAYKELCKQLHPDVNKDDPKSHDKFVQLQDAYTILSTAVSRQRYDRELEYGRQSSMRPNPMYDHRYKYRYLLQPFSALGWIFNTIGDTMKKNIRRIFMIGKTKPIV